MNVNVRQYCLNNVSSTHLLDCVQSEPSGLVARGHGSSWMAPPALSVRSQPWPQTYPDPWDAPQNSSSPVSINQTWISPAHGTSLTTSYLTQIIHNTVTHYLLNILILKMPFNFIFFFYFSYNCSGSSYCAQYSGFVLT